MNFQGPLPSVWVFVCVCFKIFCVSRIYCVLPSPHIKRNINFVGRYLHKKSLRGGEGIRVNTKYTTGIFFETQKMNIVFKSS